MSTPYWVPVGATVPGPAALVTALPGSPVDGQEVILVDSLTAPTYQWHMKYVAAKATNKWVFLGGAPIYLFNDATISPNTTAYAQYATTVPDITVPRAGDYFLEIGCNVVGIPNSLFMSYQVNAVAASDTDALQASSSGASMRRLKRTFAAGDVLSLRYRADTTNTQPTKNRWWSLVPVAIT